MRRLLAAAACASYIALSSVSSGAAEKHRPLMVTVETVNHQRYRSAGDWLKTKNGIAAKVSAMSKRDYEFLIAIHELVEAYLCEARGISQASVDAWDTGPIGSKLDEPGDDPRAPYAKEHKFASKIERLVADELGVDWGKYADEVAGK